ncbi:MAG TPA: hypothetical protein ENN43_05900 [bacterium]|nr:hypothetical protein [bacterium]
MAEIDIDKMLEESEKREKQKQLKQKVTKALIAASGAAAAVLVVFIFVMAIMGEKSVAYMPLGSGQKLLFNVKGKAPEEWQFDVKKHQVEGVECSALVMTNQGNFSTKQEYYRFEKKAGLILAAYSSNYGKKYKAGLVILPERIKQGMEFAAGTYNNREITGKISEKEELSTPMGVIEAFKVDYSGSRYFDRVVWYAKGYGPVKIIDRASREEKTLVSVKQ